MLAKPTNGISEVLDKFQDSEFTVEYKYDGERAQVHVDEAGHVSIYSRNRSVWHHQPFTGSSCWHCHESDSLSKASL